MLRTVVSAVLLCTSLALGAETASITAGEFMTAARQLINAYFTALKEGDTEAMRHMLGGRLALERASLLASSNYVDQLRLVYGEADFEIVKTRVVGPMKVQFDSKVALTANQKLFLRYIVEYNAEKRRPEITQEITGLP